MTRQYAPSDTKRDVGLKDYERYTATLADMEGIVSSPEYGGGKRLQITWKLEDGSTLRDWLGFKTGLTQGNEPSKMRTLLNAIAGRKPHAPIEWVDDETLDFKFPDDDTTWQISRADKVAFRGKNNVKFSQTGEEISSYRITTYESADIPF
jgi:hypothetical protein